ncbi:MAG: lytic transglycosylase domain-containing protein [Rhodospirillaceae bacterium]|jgi:soluble lytic murein transglycosylase|nr:lytic transglycosylase domain-containing protein [Rhodospirillaceae bacterium]
MHQSSEARQTSHALTSLGRAALLCAAIVLGAPVGGFSDAEAAVLSASDRSKYKTAFKAAARSNWGLARRWARRARNPLPRKVLKWREMLQQGNGYGFSEIVRFVDRNPDWPKLSDLRDRAEEAIDETTPTKQVIDWFAKRPPRTTDGMIAHGQALISRGQKAEGSDLLRRAWIHGRFNRRAERLFMRQYRKRFTRQDHWKRLDQLLWKGHHRSARRMLRRVTKGQRALGLARIALRRRSGGVDGAISRVPEALRRDPGLLYERLRWRRRKARDLDAMEILRNPPENMGRPELWAKERAIIARRLLAKGHISDAYKAVRDHKLNATHRARFAEVEWLTGWIALRFLSDPAEARARFQNLYEGVKFPVSRARAAYWTGRAAKAMKDEAIAAQWFERAALFPTTYHGQLSVLALNQKIHLPPPPARPKNSAVKKFKTHELAKIARVLQEIGQKRHVKTFLVQLGRINPSSAYKVLAGELAQSIGRPDLGVWVARYAQREGAMLPSIGYPLYAMPDKSPERALLLAVARQESNFDTSAVSHAGARGVMQLMPATARRVARQYRMRYSRSRLNSDPTYNVELGRRYLRDMIDKFSGSYVLAVAAYNAGPNAVRRWLRRNGDPRNGIDDPIDWIELIPYRETRDYVQRVMGNLQIFRNRLKPGRVVMTLDRDLRR